MELHNSITRVKILEFDGSKGSSSRKGRGTNAQMISASAWSNRRSGLITTNVFVRNPSEARRPDHSQTALPSGSVVTMLRIAENKSPAKQPAAASVSAQIASMLHAKRRRGVIYLMVVTGMRSPSRLIPWRSSCRNLFFRRFCENTCVIYRSMRLGGSKSSLSSLLSSLCREKTSLLSLLLRFGTVFGSAMTKKSNIVVSKRH